MDSDAGGGTSKSAPPSVAFQAQEPIVMAERGAPPPSFICPLTLELMVDPVTAADGHSYESAAIKQWLQSSALSPLTGKTLPNKKLTRSHALRNAIEEWQAGSAASPSAPPAAPAPAMPSGAALKLIVLGDAGVGKTSFVHWVKERAFNAMTQPTIGCSFVSHTLELPQNIRENTNISAITLNIWDTAGQEKYRAFTRQYFRGAVAALLMYDITRSESFAAVSTWLSELQREAPNIAASVVGCKLDLEAQRKVTRAEAEAFARGNSLGFFECSAKAGTNVDECIGELGARLVALGLHRQSALGGLGGLAAAKAHPAVRPVASDPCAGAGCTVQ